MGFFTFSPTNLNSMSGSYFLPRIMIALLVPLTLASFAPTTSHPELGTDVGPLVKSKKPQVYRSSDVSTQAAMEEAQKAREIVRIQATRRGQKLYLKRKEEGDQHCR